MTKKNSDKKIKKKIGKEVKGYLNIFVYDPVKQSIDKDLSVQTKLADIIITIEIVNRLVYKEGIEFDKDFLKQLGKEEKDKTLDLLYNFISLLENNKQIDEKTKLEMEQLFKNSNSRKHLFAYFYRELNWTVISVFSSSYISAHVLMRSLFELLIGIATFKNGSMKKRIDSIPFLSDEQKTELNQYWKYLCGWGHPYRKWEKEICPIYISHTPLFHKKMCHDTLLALEKVIGFYLLIVIHKFEIHKDIISNKLKEHNIEIEMYPFIRKNNNCRIPPAPSR